LDKELRPGRSPEAFISDGERLVDQNPPEDATVETS
jgi:hypothetical protein